MGGRKRPCKKLEKMEKKKILLAYYSQSGQIKEILDQFVSPLSSDGNYEFFYHQIKPVNDYPFPWSSHQFFDAFPESVTEVGCELKPMPADLKQKYDLVVLGLQVWYLSPSIPIAAFLKSDDFKSVATNTPIITINGCRNMWYMAQRSIKKYVQESKAKYTGHLVFFDKVNNLTSVITIMYWAFTARKDKKWGVFPKPGISDKDISESSKYGTILKDKWETDDLDHVQEEFIKNKGVIVLPHLMSMEHKAKRIFKIWTKFVLKKGKAADPNRAGRLRLFKYYLLFMIYFLSPIATVVFYLTYPLFYSQIRKNIKFYKSVS